MLPQAQGKGNGGAGQEHKGNKDEYEMPLLDVRRRGGSWS
jgi:hypothetical protein